jgi:hypothetical protein
LANHTRCFPGRLTLEEWLTVPFQKRMTLIARAQCDLLGSFRFCADKRCRRVRTCCGKNPHDCADALRRHRRVKLNVGMSNALRREWARIRALERL